MDDFATLVSTNIGIDLTPLQVYQFSIFETELLAWNEKFNLTAIRDVEGIRIKHFLDSLTCRLVFGDQTPGQIIDVGTGAGFPGIPLKIMYPEMQLVLVDSVGKKTNFCQHVVNMLDLKGVKVLTARGEDIGHLPAYREKFDWAIARAVSSMNVLAEYLLPLVKVGGAVLAQKGTNALNEVQSAASAFEILGGIHNLLIPVNLPGINEQRYLVTIEKIKSTPPQYPRRAGVPTKNPL